MKKTLAFAILVVAFGCGTKVSTESKPLYEILTQQSTGGAQVAFFEILTEAKEIKMLENDENLKRKIKPNDINQANFIILNLGEKTSGGYSITVDKVEETKDKIIVTTKQVGPAPGDMTTSVITYPYTIVKVNSKKPIEFK